MDEISAGMLGFFLGVVFMCVGTVFVLDSQVDATKTLIYKQAIERGYGHYNSDKEFEWNEKETK